MTSHAIPLSDPLVDVERARALLRAAGIDALVASTVPEIYYLSNHRVLDPLMDPTEVEFAILPADPALDPTYTVSAVARLQLEDFPAWPGDGEPFGAFVLAGAPPPSANPAPDAVSALTRALAARGLAAGGTRIAVQLDHLPVAVHARVREALPAVELVDAGPLLRELRTRKTDAEVVLLRHAARAVERAIDGALAEVEPGVRELDVDRRIRELLARDGVVPTSVFVGTADHGACVVSWATERRIARGEVVRVDVTASYGLYHADLSRNVAVGEASHELRSLYRASRRAMEAAAQAAGADVPTAQVAHAAVAAARAEGLDEFARTHVGHGVGLQVHEWPYLTPGSERIPPGAVLAIEAPWYVYGVAGFSPEDLLHVREDGVERWTYAPEELPVVGT